MISTISATVCRPVYVAGLVKDYLGVWIASVNASAESIKHGFDPGAEYRRAGVRGRPQIENGPATAAGSSTDQGRAVETPVGTENHSSVGIASVIASGKAVERREYPAGTFGSQPEDRATPQVAISSREATELGCAVEVSVAGDRHPSDGIVSVL